MRPALRVWQSAVAKEPLGNPTANQDAPLGYARAPRAAGHFVRSAADARWLCLAAQGREMVRYADDFVILCRTEAEAQEALREVEQWTQSAGLTLHPTKTRIVNAVTDGFDFLGYHFERGKRWPRKKSLQKLKETIRSLTRRNNGHSLAQIIERVNRALRGWYEYFKHSQR